MKKEKEKLYNMQHKAYNTIYNSPFVFNFIRFLFVQFIIFIMFGFGGSVSAQVFFEDGFESGDLNSPKCTTGSWGASNDGSDDDVSVSNTRAHSGLYSLQFFFGGNSNQGDDAWAEQRFYPEINLTELWVRYYLYIPINYNHRHVLPNNNKFIAIYRNPYTSPGFQVNFSTGSESDEDSFLRIHSYRNGAEQYTLTPAGGANFISFSDHGQWIEIIVHTKVPTNEISSDGIMQMWKNGVLVANEQTMSCYGGENQNYINELYLLGWANSGFDEDTHIYIDDVVFSTSYIGPESGLSDSFPAMVDPPIVLDFLPNPNNIYYCAPSGSNSTGDGSIGNPWVDFIGADGDVVPGDLIYFRGGVYPEYSSVNFSRSQNILTIDGVLDTPIVITNYPGEIASWNSVDTTWSLTLDGDNQKLIGTMVGDEYGIKINGGMSVRADNVQVSGVEFSSGTSNGGDNNHAMLSVPLRDGCDNLKITHNYFHDATNQPPENRMSAIKFFTTKDVIVEYNLFKDNYDVYQGGTINFKDMTENAIVRNNRFINSAGAINYFAQGNFHDGLNVYNNLFYGLEGVFYFTNEAGPNVRMHDNVAVDISGSFFYFLNADPIENVDRGEYYNNIINGSGFEKGWHSNSNDLDYMPNFFDYNLWYNLGDQNGVGVWGSSFNDLNYHVNSIVSDGVVSYDPVSMTVIVEDDYAGLGVGRYGDNIGGFVFSNDIPTIITTFIPDTAVNTNYSQTIQTTGGTTPYTYSITAGSLPTGLSLNASSGVISGIPTVAGVLNFIIQVTDSDSPVQTDTQELSITVIANTTTYNISNFIQLVIDWLKNGAGLTIDINNDEVVNSRDLGIMMSNWGI